jgi:hypothetical protein
VVDRDISGVPLFELVSVYDAYGTCNVLDLSERTGINERTLRTVLVKQTACFVGLGVADPTIQACSQNISSLVRVGEIHIVPSARGGDLGRRSARLMLEDEMWGKEVRYSETLIAWRIAELMELRAILCVHPNSAEHESDLRRDAERTKKRRDRERAARTRHDERLTLASTRPV